MTRSFQSRYGRALGCGSTASSHGFSRGGYWKEILNSDADVYGGSGIGNRGGMNTENFACRGHEHSLVVTAPPLAVVVFAAEP